MIQKLSYVFGSKTKAQEIVFLQHDLKPIVRQGFYAQELARIERYCAENNLHMVKSNFKVLLSEEEGYSNKGMRIAEKDKRPGMFFVYISKDEEKAWLAAYHELMNDHKGLGAALGYPSCCVEYFTRNFSSQNPNPQKSPTNAWTNISKRGKDCVLLSHFPCNSDCEKSVGMAQGYAKLLMDVDRKRAKEVLENLK